MTYIEYHTALERLQQRFEGVTPEELAGWVFDGALAGYLNANELGSARRFNYAVCSMHGQEDYVEPLRECEFLEDDIASFKPAQRYITGRTLMERWGRAPNIKPDTFVINAIRKSRLDGMHPTLGPALGITEPPIEACLFMRSQVEEIERESGIAPFLPGQDGVEARSVVPTGEAQYQQKLPAQEQEILRLIVSMQLDPKALPKQKGGKNGVKHAIRNLIKIPGELFLSDKVFDKAWERLRAQERIKDQQ